MQYSTFVQSTDKKTNSNQTGLRGKIWENGKITAGVVPGKKIRQADREYDRDYEYQFDSAFVPVRDYKGYRVEEQAYFIPERSQEIIEQNTHPKILAI